jgi:hypothetical protein
MTDARPTPDARPPADASPEARELLDGIEGLARDLARDGLSMEDAASAVGVKADGISEMLLPEGSIEIRPRLPLLSAAYIVPDHDTLEPFTLTVVTRMDTDVTVADVVARFGKYRRSKIFDNMQSQMIQLLDPVKGERWSVVIFAKFGFRGPLESARVTGFMMRRDPKRP